ncbi:MAG TPA: Rrf2 family transcriptional regulator [Deltaproteobacteria bacterium]|nr:Rrf2 family transcriptional regulator [Deltaproteobacteria bacterium]
MLGLLYMAGKGESEFSYIDEIAQANHMPKAYLAKLMQLLANRNLVKSYRGRVGGFVLARPPEEINLLDIVEAIEGPVVINECITSAGYCSRYRACPIYGVLLECRREVTGVLASHTLASLAPKVGFFSP